MRDFFGITGCRETNAIVVLTSDMYLDRDINVEV